MEREGKICLNTRYTVYYSVQRVRFERHSQRNLCRLSYAIGRRQSFRRLRSVGTRVGMPRWLVPTTTYALTRADGLTVSRRLLLLLLVRFASIYLSCTHNCSCRRRRRERHPFKKRGGAVPLRETSGACHGSTGYVSYVSATASRISGIMKNLFLKKVFFCSPDPKAEQDEVVSLCALVEH